MGVFPATKGADMATPLPNQLLRRSFVKTVLRRLIALITVVGLVYGLIAVVYATKTIFKVKMNYAVVLERFGGIRQAVTDVGWHARLPYFTRIEQEVPLMNQTLQLGGTPAPMRIISKGNVALWTSGVLTYRIRDLNTWAIENLSPLDLLQGDYDGIVKDILQAQEVNRLISDREAIKEDDFRGVEITAHQRSAGPPSRKNTVSKWSVSYSKRPASATNWWKPSEEKKRRELIAEAENYAADQEASRIRKLYAAYLERIQDLQNALGREDGSTDTALLQFLTQQKWAAAYEKHQLGQNTVVIQNTQGNTPTIALPAFNAANAVRGRKRWPDG
jgi:hypothetical protein